MTAQTLSHVHFSNMRLISIWYVPIQLILTFCKRFMTYFMYVTRFLNIFFIFDTYFLYVYLKFYICIVGIFLNDKKCWLSISRTQYWVFLSVNTTRCTLYTHWKSCLSLFVPVKVKTHARKRIHVIATNPLCQSTYAFVLSIPWYSHAARLSSAHLLRPDPTTVCRSTTAPSLFCKVGPI